MAAQGTKFIAPGWLTRNVFNRAVDGLGRLGISLAGHRTLTVRGRKSGEPRTTPVNPLEFEGETYLVAPRGTTQWVRNLDRKSTRLNSSHLVISYAVFC